MVSSEWRCALNRGRHALWILPCGVWLLYAVGIAYLVPYHDQEDRFITFGLYAMSVTPLLLAGGAVCVWVGWRVPELRGTALIGVILNLAVIVYLVCLFMRRPLFSEYV